MGCDGHLCTCVQTPLEAQIFFSGESSQLSLVFSEQQRTGQQNEISKLGDLETPMFVPRYGSGTKEISCKADFFLNFFFAQGVLVRSRVTSEPGSMLSKV